MYIIESFNTMLSEMRIVDVSISHRTLPRRFIVDDSIYAKRVNVAYLVTRTEE